MELAEDQSGWLREAWLWWINASLAIRLRQTLSRLL